VQQLLLQGNYTGIKSGIYKVYRDLTELVQGIFSSFGHSTHHKNITSTGVVPASRSIVYVLI
jgi:hypothetical protein